MNKETFKTGNWKTINIKGTCLQGFIDTTYSKLLEMFGEPSKGDGYKVDAEWVIKFKDGIKATIYNYKDGKNYCGENGEEVEGITDWHIGGHSKEVVSRIDKLINTDKGRQK